MQAVQNFKNAAHYDLKTVKIVMPDGTACSVVKAAKRIIDAMEAFFDDFGTSVHECLAFQRLKFEDPHTRYAWKIREEYGQGFVARGPATGPQAPERVRGVGKDPIRRWLSRPCHGWLSC